LAPQRDPPAEQLLKDLLKSAYVAERAQRITV
jgi:hypothetical protein